MILDFHDKARSSLKKRMKEVNHYHYRNKIFFSSPRTDILINFEHWFLPTDTE